MRWALQRYGTWEWLDYEFPLSVPDGYELALSAYGIVPASVPSPMAQYLGVDGRPLFEEWGTFVHCEIDDPGRVRREWTGIVKTASYDSNGWELDLVEFPGYFAGEPYQGLARATDTDPADLLRQLVVDTQSRPSSWFGCTVTGSTPVTLGTNLDQKVAEARAVMDERQKTYDKLAKTKTTKTNDLQNLDSTLSDEVATARKLVTEAQAYLLTLINEGADSAQIETARLAVVARQSSYSAALASYDAEIEAGRAALAGAKTDKDEAKKALEDAKEKYNEAKKKRSADGGAFEVRGEDLEDTYRAFNKVAKAAGIEWTTKTIYSEGAPNVRINLHYPQAGARRDDLVFDTSVNIVSQLELQSTAAYANAAVGVGAGEGAKAIRRSISQPTTRMRRTTIIDDKTIRTNAHMDAAMRAELLLCQAKPFPETITVIDHPNCRIGAWQVGDTITVTGKLRAGVTYKGLLRIVAWQRISAHEARLTLTPATPL